MDRFGRAQQTAAVRRGCFCLQVRSSPYAHVHGPEPRNQPRTMRDLSRYATVGAMATTTHYLLLVALVEWVGVAPGPAAWWGAVLGALVAYAGNRRYTFAQQTTSHRRALPRFALIALLGSLVNALIVGGGSALGLHYLLMQVLATGLVMLGTYHLNRIWTFDARG